MKMQESTAGLMICLLAGSLLVSGCGPNRKERALQDYINQLRAATAQNVVKARLTTWRLPTPVIYQPGGYSQADTGASAAKSTNPLQAYPLGNLKFVGTLVQDNQISAYIVTPDNMIYLAKPGDVIGEDYGKIVKIDSDHIEIMERGMNGNQPSERKVIMELKDSPQ